MTQGFLGGSANLTFGGFFNWSGGTINRTGTTTISSSGTLLINGSIPTLNSLLILNGSGTWTGGTTILMGGGTLVNNGTFTSNSSSPSVAYEGGTFSNAGTFIQAGTATTTFRLGTLFNNSGSVMVQAGELDLYEGGTDTGTFNVSAGATLGFGGTHTLTSTSRIFGAGTVSISSGNLALNGAYAITGSTVISGATIALDANASTGSLSIVSTTINGTGSTFTVSGPFQTSGVTLSAGVSIAVGGTTTLGSSNDGGVGIALNADASLPGRLVLGGDLVVASLSGSSSISKYTSAGQLSGALDLSGGVRRVNVISAASVLVLSAQVTDGGLALIGPGAVVLSNPGNNFTGGITVTNGLLQITSPSAFSGGITLNASGPLFGTLQVSSDGEMGVESNPLTIAGGTLVVSGTISESRPITLGDATGNGQGTINVAASDVLTNNGPVGGLAGLIKQGSGTLTLNGSLTYSGATQVMAGTLTLGPGISLPSQSVINVAPGATFDLGNQSRVMSALQDALLPDKSRAGGTVSLGSATLTVGPLGASTIFSGNINGSSGGAIVMSGGSPMALMALTGPLTNFTGGASVSEGTLLLTNTANTFTGGVSASGGALEVTSDEAMGALGNTISLASGGTLEATASFSTSRTISILSGGGTVAITAGATLTDSGNITGSSPLTISGTRLIPGLATGSGTLNLTSAQSFSGAMTIDGSSSPSSAGTITLLLNGSGSLKSVSSLTLLRQGTLDVYDASGLTSGRLSSPTSLNLSGGILSITGPTSATANESLGSLFVAGGNSVIDLIDGTSGAVDLTFSSFSLSTGATLTLELTSSSDRIYFTTPPSEPRGFIQGVDLVEAGVTSLHVQYSPTLGVVPYGTPGAGIIVTGTGGTSVPEPDGQLLFAGGVAGLLTRRRRVSG